MELQPRNINFDNVWNGLRKTVQHLICLQPIKHQSWNDNFSDIYFLCVSVPESHSHRLYFALKDFLQVHVAAIRKQLLLISNEDLLSEYNSEWTKFRAGSNHMHHLFRFLNKQLKKERQDIESQRTFYTSDVDSEFSTNGVGEMAFDIWKHDMIKPLAHRLVSIINDLIKKDRIECSIPPLCEEIRPAVLSFVEVNVPFTDEDITKSAYNNHHNNPPTEFYSSTFENSFLEASAEYYRGLAQKEFASFDCSKYMKLVIQLMEEERERSNKFLHPSTLRKIELLSSDILVRNEIERMSSVCKQYVQNEMIQELKNMHTLLRPLPSLLTILTGEFENYIRRSGMELMVAAGSEPGQFVSSIQSIHEKFLALINDVFVNDTEFNSALERALQSVVNYREDPKQPPKISERLNRYIDGLLRPKKGRSESDVEALMAKSIVIFRYIDDKDLFQKYYSKMLSNRLIAELSASMDFEELMITKMKEACGYEFTSKFSRMYTDIGISQSATQRFNEYLSKEGIKLEVPTSVMILQAGSWPLSVPTQSEPSSSFNADVSVLINYIVPRMLQDSLQQFEHFYSKNHSGRKLAWLFNHSFADVQLNYLERQFVATMTVYQLSILLQFSNRNELTLSNLVAECSLPLNILVKCAKGLVDSGILRESSNNDDPRQWSVETVIVLNTEFTSKRTQFKVPTPQSSKNQEKEVENTCSTVQSDRKYYMECSIVRIMKARKVMKHNVLVDEVIKQSQSKFVPDIQSIKKTIESLIDKMYIQRTDQNDEYEYIS